MDNKQTINCTVCSCQYNNDKTQKCELKNIIVRPCNECNTGKAEDESMCGSYRCNNQYKNC